MPASSAAPSAAVVDFILIRDEKAYNANGGSSIVGYNTRDLNTIVIDTGSHASLSANKVTLPAGIWDYEAVAPAYRLLAHRLELYNVTDAVFITDSEGVNSYTKSTDSVQTSAYITGQFTLAGSKDIELQHWTQNAWSGSGLGIWMSGMTSGLSIYATIKFWKRG